MIRFGDKYIIQDFLLSVYDFLEYKNKTSIIEKVHKEKIINYFNEKKYKNIINYIFSNSYESSEIDINISIQILHYYFEEKDYNSFENSVINLVYMLKDFKRSKSLDLNGKQEEYDFSLDSFENEYLIETEEFITNYLNEECVNFEKCDLRYLYSFMKEKDYFKNHIFLSKIIKASFEKDRILYNKIQKDLFLKELTTNHLHQKSS